MKVNQTGNRMRLGIFVSVATAMLIVVIYVIGNRQHMFSKTFHINGTFTDLGGLQVGNNVRLTGMNVGTIASVEIVTDTTVKVDMVIEKRVQKFIKKDATAIIGSEGLMGNKVINIVAGNDGGDMVADGATVNSLTPVSIDDIMKNLYVTSEHAAVITDDIATITGSVRSGNGTIGKIFMDSSLAVSLTKTVKNAQTATGGLSDNMEAVKHNFLFRGYYKKKEKEAAKKEEEKKTTIIK